MAWPTSIQNFFALIPHKVEIRTACIRYGPRCRLRVTPIYRLTRKRCIRQNKQRLLEDRAVCATYLHLIDTSRSVAALRRLVNHQLDVTGIDRGKGVGRGTFSVALDQRDLRVFGSVLTDLDRIFLRVHAGILSTGLSMGNIDLRDGLGCAEIDNKLMRSRAGDTPLGLHVAINRELRLLVAVREPVGADLSALREQHKVHDIRGDDNLPLSVAVASPLLFFAVISTSYTPSLS